MAGALDGIKVIDLTQGTAGPYCTMLLGDLGADVVKVELLEGDYTRPLGPPFVGATSAMFMSLNRNKRGIVVDYGQPRGQELLRRLIAQADVFIEDLGPGVAPGLGLGYEQLARANPRLIYASITALGTKGPLANRPATELEVQGLVGLTVHLGTKAEPPVRMGPDLAGINGGQSAFQAIGAALFQRERTGAGEQVSTSLLLAEMAVTSVMLSAHDHPDRWEGFHCLAANNEPDYGYPTADVPFYFGPPFQSEQAWADLCTFIGMPELITDPRFNTRDKRMPRIPDLKPILSEAFKKLPAAVLMVELNRLGAIAVPINDHETYFAHPQAQAMNMRLEMQLQDGAVLPTVGFPWELSETPGSIRMPPPLLGEHTRQVLTEAGLAEADLEGLASEGLIA